MPPLSRRGRTQACAVLALVVTLLGSGCLFPPVDPPGGGGDGPVETSGTRPPGTDDPDPAQPRYRTETDARAATGTMSAEVGAVTGGAEPHSFTLPARLIQVVVTLTWDTEPANDLDLRAELRERGSVDAYWSDADTGGAANAPDADDCRLEAADLILREVESTIVIEVAAKAVVDTTYRLQVDFAYLVPE